MFETKEKSRERSTFKSEINREWLPSIANEGPVVSLARGRRVTVDELKGPSSLPRVTIERDAVCSIASSGLAIINNRQRD